MNDRAERLARWIRDLDLEDQVTLTGATLLLEEIRERAVDGLAYNYDEAQLRESPPQVAYELASRLKAAYAQLNAPSPAPDGVDDNSRVVSLMRKFKEIIERTHPEVRS
jgi:hypothetical protein